RPAIPPRVRADAAGPRDGRKRRPKHEIPLMDYVPLLRRILAGNDLSSAEMAGLIGAIMDETLSPVRAAALLAGLAAKGETVDEIVGAARAMRERSVRVEHG